MEFILLVLAGCIAGVFTGLIPGIHMNTVSVATVYLMPGNQELIYFIIAMSVVHTFVDFIPSILFGAPEAENFLSVLPGHRMLLEGRGLNAIKITVFGGVIGGVVSVLFSFVFIQLIEKIKWIIPKIIPAVLVFVLLLMVSEEKNKKYSVLVILASGLLGLIVLNDFFYVKEPLFVLVTGFFAFPLIINSIMKKTRIPEQKNEAFSFSFQEIKGCLLSVLGGSIVSLIPAVGPSISAFVLSKFSRLNPKAFLALLGGINTTNIIFSFFVLIAIGKTRSGSAVAVKELGGIAKNELLLICAVVLISIIFASVVTVILSKVFINSIQKINYTKMNLIVLIFLVLLVLFFSGINGLIVSAVAAGIGLIAVKKGIKKSSCMSFLVFPVMGNYL
ncbi:MAG: tripartite tricarboxylate transporter permease [archaeon]